MQGPIGFFSDHSINYNRASIKFSTTEGKEHCCGIWGSPHSRLSGLPLKAQAMEFPPFLTAGVTYLFPKKVTGHNPSDTRPITYSPTLYKFITSNISGRVNVHLETNNIFPEGQKSYRVEAILEVCYEQQTCSTVIFGWNLN